MKKFLLSSLTIALLSACGGGSDDGSDGEGNGGAGNGGSGNEVTSNMGYFLDSAVSGLTYSSGSHSGTTGKNGEFTFVAGETVTFSFKGLELGSLTATSTQTSYTPLELFNTNDVNDQSVVNTLILLQSLDTDQNPNNGIELPHYDDQLDLSTLNINDSNFASKLAADFSHAVMNVVDEQSAKQHFNLTLQSIAQAAEFVGKWQMRDGRFGDISATYKFAQSGELTVVEYDDCANNQVYWGATVESVTRNCTASTVTMNWTLSDQLLSMSSSNLNDSCRPIRSSKNLIEASCRFDGSGLGDELIRFERIVEQLDTNQVAGNYREVGDSVSFTQLQFDAAGTGNYQWFDEADQAQSGDGDLGDFTWSVNNMMLSFTGTDNSQQAFNGSFDFDETVHGALTGQVTSSDEDGARNVALIPEFNNRLASSFVNQTVYGVYDAVTGACKQLYMFNPVDPAATPLRKESNAGSADICEFTTPITLPEASDQDVYLMSVKNGAFVIERGNEMEVCWPIQSTNLSGGSPYMSVACFDNQTENINLEIWRGL